MTIMPGDPLDGRERCGLLPVLDVFNIRQALVPVHLQQSLAHLGLEAEWSMLVPIIKANWDTLRSCACDRENHLTEKEKKIREDLCIPIKPDLRDVFKVVPKASFPKFLRFVVRNMTIIPTSVACEQSFSYFKRTQHINMGEKTSKIFLLARLNHYETNFNLL